MSKKKIKLSKNKVNHIHVIKLPDIVRVDNPGFTGSTIELTDELLADGDYTAVVGNDRAAFASFVNKHGTPLDNNQGVVIRDKVLTDDGSNPIVTVKISLTDTKFEQGDHVIEFSNCVFKTKEPSATRMLLLVKSGYEVRFKDCTFFHETQVNLEFDAKAFFSYPECQSYLTVIGNESKYCSGYTTASFDHAHGIDTLILKSLDQAYVCEGIAPKRIQADECGSLDLENLTEQNISDPTVSFRCGRGSASRLAIKNCRLHENTVVHISDTAATRFFGHSSSIKRIEIRDSVIDRAIFDNSCVTALKAVNSVCKDFYNNGKFSIMAPTGSIGFPDFPATLYKKAYLNWRWDTPETVNTKGVILKLEVPKEAKKHASIWKFRIWKFRVSEAKVVAIFDCDMNPVRPNILQKVSSTYDSMFTYRLGKVAKPTHPFDESDADCASGIHGFLTPERAINY